MGGHFTKIDAAGAKCAPANDLLQYRHGKLTQTTVWTSFQNFLKKLQTLGAYLNQADLVQVTAFAVMRSHYGQTRDVMYCNQKDLMNGNQTQSLCLICIPSTSFRSLSTAFLSEFQSTFAVTTQKCSFPNTKLNKDYT